MIRIRQSLHPFLYTDTVITIAPLILTRLECAITEDMQAMLRRSHYPSLYTNTVIAIALPILTRLECAIAIKILCQDINLYKNLIALLVFS
ncbi:MAG: hypothetical protein KME32_23080 [Mojavia pulchra JT2-VF2]|jgi:hypothetical protein|uniref:Uncharacterized protein n=1 Tax=Mojavia pulchra JT2-VF2 TaxID=287848 RepID=A0A951Q4F5_9NOST|nr:hypothetical protein [Mojavia pulchra JT2-VF2]